MSNLFSLRELNILQSLFQKKETLDATLAKLQKLESQLIKGDCDCNNFEDPEFCERIKKINRELSGLSKDCSVCVRNECLKAKDIAHKILDYLKQMQKENASLYNLQ